MKQNIMPILAVFIVGMLVVIPVSATQFGNLYKDDNTIVAHQLFQEQLQKAIEMGNYEMWAELMKSQITEENFKIIVDKHEQNSEYREIREQIKEATEVENYELVAELKAKLPESENNGQFKAHQMSGSKKPFFWKFKIWGK
ncbi:hypothetical protein ISS08_01480 [Candidatus Pacearchaeota archaeon]|nr:hypothetical protein [Candidatus Pacearchaeota archaeon]